MDIKTLKKVKTAGIDFSDYEDKEVRIESWDDKETTSEFGTGVCLRLSTEPVVEITDKSGKIHEICGSELFNLTQDENGAWGFSDRKNAKIQKFMKMQNVTHPKELIGTLVKIKLRIKTYDDGSQKEFLGFQTE
jgi:hypothetical protein